ncbi:MAG: serine hydrolase domain-containing protein [Polyangiaceae bacterium]|jgi:CubicO group peptidase (beta-lactamase class C family)
MSKWQTGIVAAVVSAAAMVPLGWSVRLTHAKADAEVKPKLPEKLDLDALDRYVAATVKEKGFVGLSLAIVRDGKIVLAKGYGESSIEDHVPVDADTAFGIGSVTKQFTCAAALMLADEGKLSFDDKVARFFPKLSRAADVAVGDLAAHVSGYPDYYPLDFVDDRLRHPITADDILARYASGKLDFEPGTRWSYSNTGYILLGRILERVTLEPLGTLFEQRIFTPFHLLHVAYEPKAGTKGLAQGYETFALGAHERAEREAPGWLGAAGGIYATPTDLAKWDLALMDGKVVTGDALRRMSTPRTLADGRNTGYACGLVVSQRRRETVFSHGGEVNGFLARNVMIPRLRSAVIALSNDLASDPHDLTDEILDLLLKDREPATPPVAGPPAKDVARALVAQLQSGALDRAAIGADFSAYVSDGRAKAAAAALAPLGSPKTVELESTSERGGMEATRLKIVFEKQKLGATMLRSTDGKVQEFLLEKD